MWNWITALRKPRPNIDSPRRGFALAGGEAVYEDTAMTVSAFYRGVMYISTQIAKLPWYVKDSNNMVISGQDNSVSFLLETQPNPEMNSMFFRLCLVQQAIIHGNAYAEIERNMMGAPVAIWPIPSKDIELWRTPEGKLIYRVIYSNTTNPDRSDDYLPYSDVFHIRNPHTKDGLVGQGIIAFAYQTLGTSMGANRMAESLFSNGGLPSGVISVKGTLEDVAYERIKTSWKESHGGRKAGGVAVLEEGATWTATAMSPDILQFLESRAFNVLELARFFGLPPTKLFDVQAATYANQEQSNLEVVTDTLDTWARILETEADIKILNGRRGGKKTELDLYSIFRGDMNARATYFTKMMQVAAISPNEIREREGMAPYPEGNKFFIATNNYTPVDRMDEVIDAQVAPNVPAPQAPAKDTSTDTNTEDGTKALNAALTNYLNKV